MLDSLTDRESPLIWSLMAITIWLCAQIMWIFSKLWDLKGIVMYLYDTISDILFWHRPEQQLPYQLCHCHLLHIWIVIPGYCSFGLCIFE